MVFLVAIVELIDVGRQEELHLVLLAHKLSVVFVEFRFQVDVRTHLPVVPTPLLNYGLEGLH